MLEELPQCARIEWPVAQTRHCLYLWRLLMWDSLFMMVNLLFFPLKPEDPPPSCQRNHIVHGLIQHVGLAGQIH